MNIKKILVYVIFAFIMVMPFSVSALNGTVIHDSNFSYKLKEDNLLDSNDISFIESIIVGRLPIQNYETYKYFVTYEENINSYRVYYTHSYPLYLFSRSYNGTLGFSIPYYQSFLFDKNDNYVSDTVVTNSTKFATVASGFSFYKGNVKYTYDEAKQKLGFSWSDFSTWNDLYLELPIVYANSDFVYMAQPYNSISYSSIESYDTYYDFPLFSNSNFPNTQDVILDLSPPLDFVGYDSDVTSVYHYYSEQSSTVEVNILIGNRPYSCSNGVTFGDNLCFNRINYDYLDFYVVTDSIISSKIYTSTNGIDFKQTSVSNFVKDIGGYVLKKSTLGTYSNKYKAYKFVFSVPDDSHLTFRIKYNSTYLSVNFPVTSYADSLYTEYDMTGKYAIGLIPKNQGINSSIKTLGDFTSYYKFSDDNFAYKYDEFETSNYVLRSIDFNTFSGRNDPIYYILNNNYDDSEYISKIKYLSSHFNIIEFDSVDSLVTFGNYTYSAPITNVTIKSHYDSFTNSGSSGVNSSTGSSLNFSDLFTNLPNFIVGLGSAFTALGTCIMIAFSSLPEMVQSVLWFCLLVSAIVLVVKLLK